jgi:hypothetical protein
MAVQAFVSPVNLTEHSFNTLSVSTQHGIFTAQNVRYPQQPFTPWWSTTLAVNNLIIDFGVLRPVDCVLVVNTNYTIVTVHLDVAGEFSPTEFSTTLTASPNPWTGRYTASAIIQPAINARYAMLQASGATTDGATHFSTGGVWWGSGSAYVPRDIRWEEEVRTLEPVFDTPLPWGAIHRRRIGHPYTRIMAKRPALIHGSTTPGVGDELSTWLVIDRAAEQYGSLAWFANRGNPAEAWVMRRVNEPAWPITHVVSEDALVLEELVAP